MALRRANAILTIVIIKGCDHDKEKSIGFVELAKYFSKKEGQVESENNQKRILRIITRIFGNLYLNRVELHLEMQTFLKIRNQDMQILIESNPKLLLTKNELTEINISKELVQMEMIKRGQNVFKEFVTVIENSFIIQTTPKDKNETQEDNTQEGIITNVVNEKIIIEHQLNSLFNSYLKVIYFMIQTENLCLVSGPEFCGKSFLVNQFLLSQSNYLKNCY